MKILKYILFIGIILLLIYLLTLSKIGSISYIILVICNGILFSYWKTDKVKKVKKSKVTVFTYEEISTHDEQATKISELINEILRDCKIKSISHSTFIANSKLYTRVIIVGISKNWFEKLFNL